MDLHFQLSVNTLILLEFAIEYSGNSTTLTFRKFHPYIFVLPCSWQWVDQALETIYGRPSLEVIPYTNLVIDPISKDKTMLEKKFKLYSCPK